MNEFEDIKAGDEIVISRRYDYRLAKVTRVTKTLIIVEGLKYSRKDGYAVPKENYYSNRICLITERTMKLVEQSNTDRKARILASYSWSNLANSNPELLKQIYSLIQEKEKES